MCCVSHNRLKHSTSRQKTELRLLPAMWETQVYSPGWEDPLEKGMATHSNILAWLIPSRRDYILVFIRGTSTEGFLLVFIIV